LVAGVAEEAVSKSDFLPDEIATFPNLGIQKIANWGRSDLFAVDDVGRIVSQIEPKEVVSGVAYETQGQILEGYRKKGIFSVAYWDNLNPDGENPYFHTAHKVERFASLLLLPAASLQAAFPKRDLRIVGQPTLEIYRDEASRVETASLRKKLNVPPNRKIAIFFGGYGEEFDQALSLFLEGASQNPDFVYFIQPHPKAKGKAISHPNVRLLDGELTTLEAVAVADVVLCHQSTVAFQALAAKKPVVHIIPEGQKFDSLPLQKGLARRISRPDQLAEALQSAPRKNDLFECLGIPAHCTSECANAILEALH
jgi:hypothetical protein